MTEEQQKRFKESVKIAEQAAEQLEGQMQNLENLFKGVKDSLQGADRQKIAELEAMTNRAIKKAKTGGDYNAEIAKIKDRFKS